MIWKINIVFLVAAFAYATTSAQAPDLNNTLIINGFDRKIEGADFSYHSSIPLAKECLLIRATDGNSSMEWQTASIPGKVDEETVTFVWLAGIGSSPGRTRIDVKVNDQQKFSFWTDGAEQWKETADDGSTLSFRKDMTDQFGDQFGFMYLQIPAKKVTTGEPLKIRVTGGNFNKTSWYMTFKFQVKSGLNFNAFPAIVEDGNSERQLGVAGILHFGPSATARIYLDGKMIKEADVNFGYNYVRVELPAVHEEKILRYRMQAGDFSDEGTLTLKPVRKWRVNFVQHSHTDIGYTRPQTEILAEHLRYIDYALDYCDITDAYPDESKFRWTCEASWAVDEYMKYRPEKQVERLKKRIKKGRIELTGMYFNFDELPDEQTLAASLQPIRRFKKEGMEVKVAMQNDVNGIGWCLNDYYNDLGVKFLNMGTHGHRALIAFDVPTLFWWESPSGKRMLAYRAEHYMTGNTVFKIHAGDFNQFENELLTYLSDLERKGYAYDLISIQHSGFLTDNSPPSMLASDMILKWNEKYAWPKLKTASATEFFEEMEADYGKELQVIRGAWPDWWTDGFGASAREVAAIRTAQTDLIANAAGLTMAALQGSVIPENTNKDIEDINSALLFYTEHTVGYHGSVREPFSENTMEQRAIKESYAWEAARRAKMLGEKAMGLLQSHIERGKEPALVVYNTLNWNRGGLFEVYIDHQILPRYHDFKIVDEKGQEAKAQPAEHFSDGTMWAFWVDDVPAFGFRKYKIIVHIDKENKTEQTTAADTDILENKWYKITADKNRGAITSLFDKQLKKEIIDQDSEYALGEFIYETLDNRSQMESFKLDNYKREPLDSVWIDGFDKGSIWNTIRFKGKTRAVFPSDAYGFEIRLFNTTKRIDLVYSMEKKMVTDPEGIYIAFPFQLEDGVLSFDVQGGEIRAGVDQIPGSANDWNTVQNYARLSNNNEQVMLGSPEIPMMQFGGINTGRYKAGATPETTHIFGWPMNNYWVTNFNAEQHGGITWKYTISSETKPSPQSATRFGWGNRVPMLSRIIPGGGEGSGATEGSMISGWPENLLLVSSSPGNDSRSCILHVREVSGREADLSSLRNMSNRSFEQTIVNVLGQPVSGGDLKIMPYESKFIELKWK
jgi:alpha-mannosidase